MSVDIVALVGCARSGSTMLEGKLQQAADITALGEVTYIWSKGFLRDELCGCGVNFSKCGFWNAVLAEAFPGVTRKDASRFDAAFSRARGGIVAWDGQLGRPPPLDPLFAEVARALYLAAHKVGGGRTLLDSSKAARFTASLKEAQVGRIMPVHMFRGAPANIYSLKTPKARPQAQDGAKAAMARSLTVFHAVARWKLTNLHASNLVCRQEGAKATVSYERFCSAPDEQLQALMAELGLAPRRDVAADTWHSVSGNPMRFTADRLQIRADERWKRGLSRLEQCIIALGTAQQQRRLEESSLGFHPA